jgi:hypothetical protein
MAWEISLHPEVEEWYLALCQSDPETADLIEDAIDQLVAGGPSLGRPLADRVKGSAYHNMKELRPPSSGQTEIRMLFAFDPRREAIFLVAGDKAGNWEGWYREAIPLADERFAQHLAKLAEEGGTKQR